MFIGSQAYVTLAGDVGECIVEPPGSHEVAQVDVVIQLAQGLLSVYGGILTHCLQSALSQLVKQPRAAGTA